MTHTDTVPRWLKTDGIGVEIGAFQTPVPGIKPFYVDRFSEFAGQKCLADFWGDACHLPFHTDALDYVVSSHVLEHVANPVAALVEWHRVLRDGGMIYAVVPDRRQTFDHARDLTSVAHMWSDFEQGVDQSDGTHSDEFLDHLDWSQYRPDLPPERIAEEREKLRECYHVAAQGGEINIHFHVFEASNLRELAEHTAKKLRLQWEIVEVRDHFPAGCPNGILLVIRVRKNGLARLRAIFRRIMAGRDRKAVVHQNAQPLNAAGTMRRRY